MLAYFGSFNQQHLKGILIRLLASNNLSVKVLSPKCQQIPLGTFFTMECGEGTCRHTLTVKCIKKIKCADTCGDLIKLNS